MDPIRLDRGRGGGFLTELGARRREIHILAAVAAILVALSLVAWARRSGPAIAPPTTSLHPAPFPSEPDPSLAAERLFVHVAGAVRRPGLYGLPPGSRVMDAIVAAGGATEQAKLDLINLAEVIVDGMKIEVPKKGGPSSPSVAQPSASAGAVLVNINSADQSALETIPGVGPVTAAAIIAFRTEVGGFASVDQLLEVDGIGPATLESILPYVTT